MKPLTLPNDTCVQEIKLPANVTAGDYLVSFDGKLYRDVTARLALAEKVIEAAKREKCQFCNLIGANRGEPAECWYVANLTSDTGQCEFGAALAEFDGRDES